MERVRATDREGRVIENILEGHVNPIHHDHRYASKEDSRRDAAGPAVAREGAAEGGILHRRMVLEVVPVALEVAHHLRV